jgi:hypothetical protein
VLAPQPIPRFHPWIVFAEHVDDVLAHVSRVERRALNGDQVARGIPY